jgi:O-antigen ligase
MIVKNSTVDKKSNSVWLLLLGVVSTNLYVSTKAMDPFNTPKLILLLIISGWLFGHIVKFLKSDFRSLESIQACGLIVIFGFLLSMLISSLKSDSIKIAIIGDTSRRNGLLSYIGLAIILVFAMQVMNFKYSIRLYKIALINGLVVGIYGLIQTFGKDFITWNNPYNSLIATLGNPNFASAILAVFAVLAFAILLLKDIPLYYKTLALSVLIISIYCIYRSNSRQGIVSLSFALMFYLSVYFYLYRKVLGIIFAAFSATLALVGILGMLQMGPLRSLLYKPSVSIRGYYWNAAIEMFKSNPLTGVGIDSYGYYFREFRNINYPINYGFEITSSNAHNVFLHFFATGGVFLGITYLALMFLIFSAGIIGLKHSHGENRLIQLGLLSGWIAYQTSSFISIDNIGISIWNWLLGGTILGLSSVTILKNQKKEKINAKSVKVKAMQIDIFQPVISILVLIPILVISMYLNRSETDTLKVSAYASNPKRYGELILNHAQGVFKNPLSDPNYRLDCALAMIDAGFTDEGISEINKLEKAYPRNEYVITALSELSEQQSDLPAAIDYRVKLAIIDPYNAKNYLRLLVLYKGIGDLGQANVMQAKINELFPNSQFSAEAQSKLAN